MKKAWIVRWRGLEETSASPQEAIDRLDQLAARGIEAELFAVVAGQRRKLGRGRDLGSGTPAIVCSPLHRPGTPRPALPRCGRPRRRAGAFNG